MTTGAGIMTTREYEALFILKAAGTEQEVAQSATQLEEPIRRVGGNVAKTNSLGRRRLAFRISRQGEGFYHVVRFNAPTERLSELQRIWRLNERVVRFIVLNGEEVPLNVPPAAPAAIPEPAVARS